VRWQATGTTNCRDEETGLEASLAAAQKEKALGEGRQLPHGISVTPEIGWSGIGDARSGVGRILRLDHQVTTLADDEVALQ
jgi:hypothetical protein